MKQRKGDKAMQTLAGVVLLLFVTYYANVSLFQHTHIINGVTIVHSHIHSSHHSDTPSGGHTANDLTLISALSHYKMETASHFEWQEMYRSINLIGLKTTHINFYSLDTLEHAPLRGPPTV